MLKDKRITLVEMKIWVYIREMKKSIFEMGIYEQNDRHQKKLLLTPLLEK